MKVGVRVCRWVTLCCLSQTSVHNPGAEGSLALAVTVTPTCFSLLHTHTVAATRTHARRANQGGSESAALRDKSVGGAAGQVGVVSRRVAVSTVRVGRAGASAGASAGAPALLSAQENW